MEALENSPQKQERDPESFARVEEQSKAAQEPFWGAVPGKGSYTWRFMGSYKGSFKGPFKGIYRDSIRGIGFRAYLEVHG